MSTQHDAPTAAELLGPGGAFELIETDINGVRLPTFKNAHSHLREYYQAALEWADETFYVYEDERYTFADASQHAERVAGAAMPNTENTPEYASFRKMQVYESAISEAQAEGGVSPKERTLLNVLRDSLGISETDAEAIEGGLKLQLNP